MRTRLLISTVTMLFICQCVFAQSNLRSTYSWLEGHWSLIIGNYSAHLYFDSDRQWVKYYIRSIYDTSYPRPEYEGKYTIDDGKGKFSGYKVIYFGESVVLADPETGKVLDADGTPFSKQAQQRRNAPTCSWLEGHWSLVIGNYSAHLYFDSDRQWVKYYIRNIYDTSYPRPEYEGKYTIDDGVGNFRGYKVIRFGDTFVLANPETGIVYDELKHPFSKKD